MINGQKEIWISTGNKAKSCVTIIAVSNCGRIMRKNGKIEIARCRQLVRVSEQQSQMLIHRFLATTFIAKTEDDILKQRNIIDHITHTPTNMYINDIRNLRWCTQKENNNFPEARLNNSKSKIGNTNAKGYKHSEEAKEKMSKARIGNTNAKGYKHSEEAKEKISAKISAAKKGNTNVRGRRWYNNGITSIRAKECPPGFTSGRIIKKKSS